MERDPDASSDEQRAAWAADARTIAAVAAGDAASFRLLYDEHSEAIFRVACAVLCDREGARDVVQVVFMKLFRQAPRWQPRARVSTWLTAVAVRECLSWRRRLRRPTIALAEPAPTTPADRVLENKDARQRFSHALRQLSSRDRCLVVLHLDRDLDPKDIAPLVGMSDNATRVALFRALARLRTITDGPASGAHVEVSP